jgi:purine catabolism regulator
MSMLVCSRQLLAYLPGAFELRSDDALLPELAGVWTLGDPEEALDHAVAVAPTLERFAEFVSWAGERGAAAVVACGLPATPLAVESLPRNVSLIAWPEGATDPANARSWIGNALLRAQREQIERSQLIHERLTRVAVEGRGLPELVATLADLVQASAIVKDRSHRNLAAAAIDVPIDPVRRRSLADAATSRDVVEALERDNVFEKLRSERRPIHVPRYPQLEMLERVMAPVIVGDAYYGYISVASAGRVLERIDLTAVEHAATVAALIIGRAQAVRAHERSLRTAFVYETIFGTDTQDVMQRRGDYLGYALADGYAVMVVRAGRAPRTGARESMEHIASALDDALNHGGAHALSTVVGDDIAVALLPASGPPTAAWRARIEAAMQGVFAVNTPLELSAGIGRWQTENGGLRTSFTQARLAAQVGAHIRGTLSVTHYDALGVYRLLADAIDRDRLAAFRSEQIGAIAGDPELMKTMRVYLGARGNKTQCAKELFVHLNTVKYRLSRIADLTGHDLDDSQTLLDLHVAFAIDDILPLLR